MTTVAAVLDRVRLELGDQPAAFISNATGDGDTTVFELPASPVATAGLSVLVDGVGVSYGLDAEAGTVEFAEPPTAGSAIQVVGSAYKYFGDDDLSLFVTTAVLQHLHNRQGVTLATLPPVEDYLVALLATVEALYALLNDAAFDIDVSTPEGVGIPRSQRFRQLQEMIELRKEQYAQMCAALNVGLNRIEVFSLRRVSRTTGRLVPVYVPQELEDRQPPQRVFVPIDTHGGRAIVDPTPVLDITMYEYGYYELPLTDLGDLTGWKIDARMRRYEDSSSIREFTVEVDDLVLGNIRLNLTPKQTAHLPHRLYWDLRLTNRETREVRTLRKGGVTIIQQVGVDEAVGPVGAY